MAERIRLAWHYGRLWLLAALSIAALTALLATPTVTPNSLNVNLGVGDIAPQNIVAPERISYESRELTNQARQAALASVRDVYDPPDPQVTRDQSQRTRQVLNYIDSVRHDAFATPQQARDWIMAVPEFQALVPSVIDQVLSLSQTEWDVVEAEIQRVVERAMQEPIREDSLDEVRRYRVPALIEPNLDLSSQQRAAVIALAQALIVPNSRYNPGLTEEARQAALASVKPVTKTYERNQIIVRAGEPVTPEIAEALQHLNLAQPPGDPRAMATAALAALLVTVLLALYVNRFHPDYWQRPRQVLLLALLFIAFATAAKLMVPGRTVLPYLFPASALAMFISVIFNPHLAVAAAILLGLTVGILGGGSLELAVYATLGGLVAAFSLRRTERLYAFFWSGSMIAVANLLVLFIFRLPTSDLDTGGWVMLVGAALVNGIILSPVITLAAFFLLGSPFDFVTALQLQELARPNHPLLQELLRKAPGSYHHSLMVGNLAEQAAEAIGADALLTRVGAFYHDIGKTLRPYFYIENQVEGQNVHDRLDPRTSARILVGHVKEGLELARRYRLPSRVRAFIPEHHGTMRVSFLYQKALEEAGDGAAVDESAFRYPGPKPRSKETALLMLADGCEATVRSARPASLEEIEAIVRKVIADRVAQGQLDECGLTLQDLDRVRASFVTTLKGTFHPRIKYPEPEPAGVASERESANAEPAGAQDRMRTEASASSDNGQTNRPGNRSANEPNNPPRSAQSHPHHD